MQSYLEIIIINDIPTLLADLVRRLNPIGRMNLFTLSILN